MDTKHTQIGGNDHGQIMNNNIDEHIKSLKGKTFYQLEDGKSVVTLPVGVEYPIMYKEILAGEYIQNWSIDSITRFLTPLVPTLDKSYLTIKAFFVPNTRVWDKAEKAFAGKAEANTANETMAYENELFPRGEFSTIMSNSKWHMRTVASAYGIPNNAGNTYINMLPIRGYRAIVNDYLRNKEYEVEHLEFKTTEVSNTERNQIYIPNEVGQIDWGISSYYMLYPAQARKSYWTNLKRNMTGKDISMLSGTLATQQQHLDWQAKYMDNKQRELNANKNDWDIIAEMGGTSPVRTDRTEFLGQIEYELNYQQVSQTSASSDLQVLGTAGSFSYTRANGEIFGHKEFKQHGYIHILASINIEKNYEEGTPKELLKLGVTDVYRAGLGKKEVQEFYNKEISNTPENSNAEMVAYQPAWAEYKRLPILCTGSARSVKPTSLGTYISQAHWHNMVSKREKVVISRNYFNPWIETEAVISRNSALNSTFADSSWINISVHKVKASLPIEEADIRQTEHASKQR